MDNKVKRLITFLKREEEYSKRDVYDYIIELGLTKDDLEDWSDYSHPVSDSYGRNTIYQGEHFELMVMSWVPGDFSMIHNHGDAAWGIVQVFGDLTHRVYKLEELHLSKVKEEVLASNQMIPVTHDLIHQMGNDSDEPILSLHFYYNETPTEFITDNTFLFDVVQGEVLTVRGGAFYGLPKDEIFESRKGLTSSEELKLQEVQLLEHRLGVIS